jgi:hypothetical protein
LYLYIKQKIVCCKPIIIHSITIYIYLLLQWVMIGVSLGKSIGKFIVPEFLSHTALRALGRLHLQGVSVMTSSGSLTSITMSLDPALFTNFRSSSGDETPGFLSFNEVFIGKIALE